MLLTVQIQEMLRFNSSLSYSHGIRCLAYSSPVAVERTAFIVTKGLCRFIYKDFFFASFFVIIETNESKSILEAIEKAEVPDLRTAVKRDILSVRSI